MHTCVQCHPRLLANAPTQLLRSKNGACLSAECVIIFNAGWVKSKSNDVSFNQGVS